MFLAVVALAGAEEPHGCTRGVEVPGDAAALVRSGRPQRRVSSWAAPASSCPVMLLSAYPLESVGGSTVEETLLRPVNAPPPPHDVYPSKMLQQTRLEGGRDVLLNRASRVSRRVLW